jgi:predicted ATP-dependent serine protease
MEALRPTVRIPQTVWTRYSLAEFYVTCQGGVAVSEKTTDTAATIAACESYDICMKGTQRPAGND